MRRLLIFLLCSTWMVGQSKISDNQIRTPPPLQCSDTTTSGTTQTCTTAPSFTPAAKDCVTYNTTTTNTGALTLNVNSQGAKPVQKWLGSALVAGDVVANKPQLACYDGTNWQLSTIGNAPGTGSGTVTSVATTSPIGGGTITSTGTLTCTTCLTATSPTNHGVLLGAGSQAVGASTAGTSGQVLTSNGASSDPTFQAASSSGGPSIGNRICSGTSSSTSSTKTCASTINVATNDFLFLFCGEFLADGGTATLSASDSLTNTYTSVVSFYSSNYGGRIAAFWAKSSSAGADTFTCTSSSGSSSFWGIAAIKVVGASASPIDVAASGTQAASGNTGTSASMLTTSTNDLIFTFFEYAGSAVVPQVIGGSHVVNLSSNGFFLGSRQTGTAGTYYAEVDTINGGSGWGNIAFAVH